MSTNQNLMQHMRELIDRIKAADVAYYRDDNPTMTDREYDLLVDELKELETTTGLILSGSPTQTVPGKILKELTPVRHTKPMLSADEDDHFPAINIYWDHDGGKASELLCFAEYNSERNEGAQVCIGTYVSDEDETQYYAPYMAERNKEP